MSRGEGIKKLNSLFDKYKHTLKAPQGSVITAFIEVVYDVLGITIKKEAIRYSTSSRTLVVQGGGPLKSEITLNKEEILTHLKGRLGEQSAPKEIL